MKRSLVLLALTGLVASNALANQVEKKDSWILSEISTSDAVICEASTTDNGVLRDYTLKIQKVKNSHFPVEVFLHEKGKADYGPIAAAVINNEVLLFNQFSAEAKSQSFWYLPDETKLLVDLLKTGVNSFSVKPYADLKGKDLKFSLKGAAQILASMEKRCNAGKALVDERLAKLTNHPASFDQAPKVFDANTLGTIRANYYELAEHYRGLVANEEALAKLVNANLPNITERDNLRVEKADLVSKKIPGLKQDIDYSKNRSWREKARSIKN